jgi:hypothetical protein
MSHIYNVPNSDLVINVNSDWSGDADVVAPHGAHSTDRRVFTLDASALLSGDFESPSSCPLTERELRMATASAMLTYCRNAAINAIEDIEMPDPKR